MRAAHLAAVLVLAGALNIATGAAAQSQGTRKANGQRTADPPLIVVTPSLVFGSQGSVSSSGTVRSDSLGSRAVRTRATTNSGGSGSLRGQIRFVRVLQGQQSRLIRQSQGIAGRLRRLESNERRLANLVANNSALAVKLHDLEARILTLWHSGESANNQAGSLQRTIAPAITSVLQQLPSNPSLAGLVGGLQRAYSQHSGQIQANVATYRALTVSF
jgi:hypothetical protein